MDLRRRLDAGGPPAADDEGETLADLLRGEGRDLRSGDLLQDPPPDRLGVFHAGELQGVLGDARHSVVPHRRADGEDQDVIRQAEPFFSDGGRAGDGPGLPVHRLGVPLDQADVAEPATDRFQDAAKLDAAADG